VKVLTRSTASVAPEDESFSSGADYLRRRREDRDERRVDVRAAHVVAERVHDALVAFASGSRRLAPQDSRLTGHTGTMVHNVAYLVPVGRSDDFAAAVGEQAAEHQEVVVDARGPWPPYSFAMLDSS
jgi:Gas vesicle synthesis protein GvpL/GvpF